MPLLEPPAGRGRAVAGSGRPWVLPAILLLGLALRIWIAAHVAVIAADGMARIAIASVFRDRGLAAGLAACLDHDWHPLNPLTIWLAGGVLGDLERAGFAVSILFGTLGILGVYLLAREAWGVPEGHLAALLWALLPNAVHFSADVLTEGQFLAFWILGAWAGLRALKRGGTAWAVAAGALGGLAYDTRAEGLGIPVGFACAGILLALTGRAPRRILARLAAGGAAGFLLLALPYLAHLRAAKGQWAVSPQKTVQNTLLQRSSMEKRGALADAPVPDPRRPAERALRLADEYAGLARTGVSTLTPWVLGLALLALWRRRPWPREGICLLVLAGVHGAVVLRLFQTAGYASHRHFMTLAAVASVWGAAGLAGAMAGLGGGRRRGWRPLLLALAVCAALLAQACQSLRQDKAYRREFGGWLATRLERGSWIASVNKPEIAYYAGGRHANCSLNVPRYLKCPPVFCARAHWLVLELGPEADGGWLALALVSPGFTPVELPAPYGSRFALLRWEP